MEIKRRTFSQNPTQYLKPGIYYIKGKKESFKLTVEVCSTKSVEQKNVEQTNVEQKPVRQPLSDKDMSDKSVEQFAEQKLPPIDKDSLPAWRGLKTHYGCGCKMTDKKLCPKHGRG